MIKLYNAIQKYIKDENSIIKFEYKHRNLIITISYYNMKRTFRSRYKFQIQSEINKKNNLLT